MEALQLKLFRTRSDCERLKTELDFAHKVNDPSDDMKIHPGLKGYKTTAQKTTKKKREFVNPSLKYSKKKREETSDYNHRIIFSDILRQRQFYVLGKISFILTRRMSTLLVSQTNQGLVFPGH